MFSLQRTVEARRSAGKAEGGDLGRDVLPGHSGALRAGVGLQDLFHSQLWLHHIIPFLDENWLPYRDGMAIQVAKS
jgi:hypothetical protein